MSTVETKRSTLREAKFRCERIIIEAVEEFQNTTGLTITSICIEGKETGGIRDSGGYIVSPTVTSFTTKIY